MKYKDSIDLSIRIYLCIIFLIYGLGKIVHIQFEENNITQIINESSNGKDVVWFFFSYSYHYTLIIGVLQCIGGVLLIFNKTKILGHFLLLPILINIVLINYFFNIGVLLKSSYFLLLIFSSICLNYKQLNDILKVFFEKKEYRKSYLVIILFLLIIILLGQLL